MQRGDTLWGISQKTGIPLEEIQAANAHIDDPTRIPVGTILNLPSGERPENTSGIHAVPQRPAKVPNPAESRPQAGLADNQPLNAEMAKKYGVEPGTTWRVVKTGQKVMAFWHAIESGEKPTREEALAIRDEIAKLRAAPDLSPRELQEVRMLAQTFIPLAHNNGNITFQETGGDPLYFDSGTGTPSGGGAVRMPGAPLGAGMNMIRPGSPPVPRLNQQIGLTLPRNPLSRDLPAPPKKRRQ